MPYARVNDIRLHYRRFGEGPPLLMLHSLASSGDDWAFQEPLFSRHFELILPDLRGFGRSEKPRGPYSVPGMAEDLRALLAGLGIERCYLLGFSMGGAVALQMAVDQPERFQRLVLVNSLASYKVDDWRKSMDVFASLAMVHVIGMRRSGRLVAKRNFPYPEQEPMRQRLIDVFAANPRHAYVAGARALIGWSVEDQLDRVACPTLVVAGEHDYTALEGKRAYCERLPRGELAVFPDSRHGTPFDSRDAFNERVIAFLTTAEEQ